LLHLIPQNFLVNSVQLFFNKTTNSNLKWNISSPGLSVTTQSSPTSQQYFLQN
jgi:hypothetical protein